MDIKKIIRQKLSEGQSQKEISDFLVERYSEYILFEPKFDQKNILTQSNKYYKNNVI